MGGGFSATQAMPPSPQHACSPFTVADRCEGPSMFLDTENKLGTELAVEAPSPGP